MPVKPLQGLLALGRPLVMGILNVTPDSFSDGGRFLPLAAAIDHAAAMVKAGADIVDIGGESTRPGAKRISPSQELDRVLPVIAAVCERFDTCVSVDTSTAEVIRESIGLGAGLVNDVRALRREGAIAAVASDRQVMVCLMHMQGDPQTMQMDPRYDDVVADIDAFFADRISACEQAGMDRTRLVLDPGFGFGKLPSHNFTLLNRLDAFAHHGLPLLVGLSRKSTIGRVTSDRLAGSLAGGLAALERGARVLRVHDVAETVSALKVWRAIREESGDYDT